MKKIRCYGCGRLIDKKDIALFDEHKNPYCKLCYNDWVEAYSKANEFYSKANEFNNMNNGY